MPPVTTRIVGLPPGRYELVVELTGFTRSTQSEVILRIAQEITLNAILKLAGLQEAVTVTGESPIIETTKSSLGTTISTRTIEELPIAGRNFSTLAQLTPGITSTGGTGISSSGQLTRNNTFLIDGLSNDDDSVAGQRGGFSVDAIKEFVVVSNTFSAEYGQASGAIVNVLTRSGTNSVAGRAFYYHRDDSWDASTAASKLVTPTPPKSKLEQKIVGGFLGGPIRRNRMFYFASVEYTDRLTENLVTAPTAPLFLPNDPVVFPQPFTNPQFIGKVDTNLTDQHMLAVRYRIDRDELIGTGIGGTATRERGQDRVRKDQDLAVHDNLVIGSRGLNEFRMQFARRYFNWDVTPYCPQCPTVNRPGLGLGKASNMPQGRTEDRWQFANAFSWIVPDRFGDHSFKVGVDASFIELYSLFHNNLDGTFTFTTTQPFDPTVGVHLSDPVHWERGRPGRRVEQQHLCVVLSGPVEAAGSPDGELWRSLGLRRRGRHRARQEQLRATPRTRLGRQWHGSERAQSRWRHLLRPGLSEHSAQCGKRQEVRADADQQPRLSQSVRAESQPHGRSNRPDSELDCVSPKATGPRTPSSSRWASSNRLVAPSRLASTS